MVCQNRERSRVSMLEVFHGSCACCYMFEYRHFTFIGVRELMEFRC